MLIRRLAALVLSGVVFLSQYHVSEAAAFPWGQCTYWAALQRPDIAATVWGNAGDWIYETSHPVGTRPEPGAIAVWSPYVAGAWGLGHTAYVLRVSGDWFLVSEEHWSGLGFVDSRWVYNQPGIHFIY